jgi:hypothetical protein
MAGSVLQAQSAPDLVWSEFMSGAVDAGCRGCGTLGDGGEVGDGRMEVATPKLARGWGVTDVRRPTFALQMTSVVGRKWSGLGEIDGMARMLSETTETRRL